MSGKPPIPLAVEVARCPQTWLPAAALALPAPAAPSPARWPPFVSLWAEL